MYSYFVSYSINNLPIVNCFGNIEVQRDEKISSLADIAETEKALEKTMNYPERSIAILNFILFERNDNQE